MQARHVSIIAHVIPAIVLSLPSVYLAYHSWLIPSIAYNFGMMLSLIVGFSNRLYYAEIDNTAWKRFFGLFSIKALSKKNIKPQHN